MKLADQLYAVREQISNLQREEAALRRKLMGYGSEYVEGDQYIAHVIETVDRRLNTAALRESLGAALDGFYIVRPRKRVDILERA